MSRQYSEIKVYMGSVDCDESLEVRSDSLDGATGLVELRNPDNDTSYGWFDAQQLIEAIQAVTNFKLDFVGEEKKSS